MNTLLWIGILSVAVSLDALGVGLAYGMKKIQIPLRQKLMMAAFSVLYTSFSVTVGNAVVHILPPNAAALLGSVILFGMGLWMCLQTIVKKPAENARDAAECKTVFEWMIRSLGITIRIVRNPIAGDADCSGTIERKEAMMIALALSLDILGVGLGCAMAGLEIRTLPFTVATAQFLFLSCGLAVGKKLANCKLRYMELIPGILLMVIAVLRRFG